MFLHQFREDLVLALELLLQEGDPPILGIADASGTGFEGGRAVLEELLLPAVEHGGVDAVTPVNMRRSSNVTSLVTEDSILRPRRLCWSCPPSSTPLSKAPRPLS